MDLCVQLYWLDRYPCYPHLVRCLGSGQWLSMLCWVVLGIMSPLHYPPPVRVLPNSFLSPNFPHHVTSSSSPVLQPLTSSPSRLPGIGYLIHLKACRRCFLNPSPSRCENCIKKRCINIQYIHHQFNFTTLHYRVPPYLLLLFSRPN